MSFATPHRIDPPINAAFQLGGPHMASPITASPITASPVRRPSSPQPNESSSADSHRIDAPHAIRPGNCDSEVTLPTPQEWLTLHATELVDRLQNWASGLDAREAQLNARSALQDHRERRFRLHQQDAATELAEQQRSIERLRKEIEAQARRLAFRADSPSE